MATEASERELLSMWTPMAEEYGAIAAEERGALPVPPAKRPKSLPYCPSSLWIPTDPTEEDPMDPTEEDPIPPTHSHMDSDLSKCSSSDEPSDIDDDFCPSPLWIPMHSMEPIDPMEFDPISPTHSHMDSDLSKSLSPDESSAIDYDCLDPDKIWELHYTTVYCCGPPLKFESPYAKDNELIDESFAELVSESHANGGKIDFGVVGGIFTKPWSRIRPLGHLLFGNRHIDEEYIKSDMELDIQIMQMYHLTKKEFPSSSYSNLNLIDPEYRPGGDPIFNFVHKTQTDDAGKFNLLSPDVIFNFVEEYYFEVEDELRRRDICSMVTYLVEGTYKEDYEKSQGKENMFQEKLKDLFPILIATTFENFAGEMAKLITNGPILDKESANQWITDRSGLTYKQPSVSRFEYLKAKFKAAFVVGLVQHLPWDSVVPSSSAFRS